MKGLIDLFFNIFPILLVTLALFFGPPTLDVKIQQQYKGTIEGLTTQDVLLALLSSTNNDALTGREDITMEILGEKVLIPNQQVNFLKEDLDKIVETKCYSLEVGGKKLVENCPAPGLKDVLNPKDILTPKSRDQKEVNAKIVLPYNPNKLTENLKLVITWEKE